MPKGVPHALTMRGLKKPIVRPGSKANTIPEKKPPASFKAAVAPKPETKQAETPKAETPKALAPAPKPVKLSEIPEPKPETKQAEAPKVEADLSLVEGSVKDLIEALETGDHDSYLADLYEAEEAGKGRKTALEALEARMA